MKSHQAEFELGDLWRVIARPLLFVVAFAGIVHCGARMRWLPSPRPALDADRAVIVHQVDSSRVRSEADVVLFGDSSCLMDLDARRMGLALGRRTLNLGLNSYFDLAAPTRMLQEFTAANPGRPRVVVLLMHPEALRRSGSEPYPLAVFTHYLTGTDPKEVHAPAVQLRDWSGTELIRTRLIARVLPWPLDGNFGRFYGFTTGLERFMSAHDGSALDPGAEPARGDADYRLSPMLENLSADFRAAVLSGTTLLVGITPVPAKFAGPKYPATRDRMLQQWGGWLGADRLLEDLPAALPDELFTGVTHLKPSAVPDFSDRLVKELRQHLP
ncbi:MAG: hypothetical protein QOF48_194 [Verrucomicrobiota bacterium]|jgi:hypothetical protein